MRTALIAKAQESQWLPIETAPKDFTRILLYDPTEVEVGYWDEDECDWRDINGDLAWVHVRPTHWTPLPSTEAIRGTG